MNHTDKNWEQNMKQILDEQEIVFDETDWEAAQGLIQAANLHVLPTKRKKRGLGWLFSLLFVGALLSVMVGSGHFVPQKMAAKELFQGEKKENIAPKKLIEEKKIVEAIAILPENKTENKAFISPKQEVLPKKMAANPAIKEAKTGANFALKEAVFAENEGIEKAAVSPENETGMLLANKVITSNCGGRTINPQKIVLQEIEITSNQNKYLIINYLSSKKQANFFSHFGANAYAGAAYSLQPYLNSTFYGGVNLTYTVSPVWKLTVFANYSERKVNFVATNLLSPNGTGFVSNPDSIADFTNVIVPPSGITANSSIMTTEQIYLRGARYIGGGIGLSFPYKRHEFFANVGYQYVLGTKSKYTVEIVDNQSLVYKNTQNIKTFVAGINRTDISVGLGYQYAITRKIGVQIAVTKGFMDMSKDSFYLNSVKHHNFQVQTGISYRLF